MFWYINRGEDMQRDQRVTTTFRRQQREPYEDSDLIFTDVLWECSLDEPARHPKEGVTHPNCTLTADLSGIDRSLIKKAVDPQGKEYYEVYFDLIITMEKAMMKFSLEVDGEEMGSYLAKYQ